MQSVPPGSECLIFTGRGPVSSIAGRPPGTCMKQRKSTDFKYVFGQWPSVCVVVVHIQFECPVFLDPGEVLQKSRSETSAFLWNNTVPLLLTSLHNHNKVLASIQHSIWQRIASVWVSSKMSYLPRSYLFLEPQASLLRICNLIICECLQICLILAIYLL